MMTPEKIAQGWSVVDATCADLNGPPVLTEAIEAAVRLLPMTLSSLTEAYAEIERLETRLHKVIGCAHSVVSPGHLEGCPLWAKLPTESTT